MILKYKDQKENIFNCKDQIIGTKRDKISIYRD